MTAAGLEERWHVEGAGQFSTVCDELGDPLSFDCNMDEARAHLIAAAPDLLALAKQVASWCLDCNYGDGATGLDSDGEPCEGCADTRAAIAKAEGRHLPDDLGVQKR